MFKKIFLIVSLCSLVGFAPATFAKDEVVAVTAAAEKLRVQMVDPDKAKLSALLWEELSYGHSNGALNTKAVFVDDLMTGVSDFLSITITEQTVKIVGDTALIRHILSGDTHDKGKEAGKVNLKVLQVWKKQGGQWKLLARQAVRIQ